MKYHVTIFKDEDSDLFDIRNTKGITINGESISIWMSGTNGAEYLAATFPVRRFCARVFEEAKCSKE